MTLLLILIIIVFLAGIYFITVSSDPKYLESLTNMSGSARCPNMLIQKGKNFYLFNSNLAEIPGVNPIEFENLEDYTEFIDWQRSQGIRCPVLYLQHGYDAQGQSGYKMRPSITEPQGGLPPASSTQNFNPNYSTPQIMNQPTSSSDLSNSAQVNEQEETSNMLFSPNAMDDNWGGERYTKSLVDAGYYEGNEVSIYIP
uniref:Uncharacterized protein n=1 Tax=viral metagenome TaxID=1070528 RepID=A0A6C0LDL5_9ZZZZ